ncbi:hypothetical protein LAZ67_18001273 [Cordylochernes scorpioides]|uniref:Retrotransposon gag domain-containing protein n=1 Tax=Cordylochernes scorpioides TaxID=51811 RepID=A0ABY6LH30_9ARAC|nr:hypothetical protein LAZ67_18001273 [Cordylochernes scorpioides]
MEEQTNPSNDTAEQTIPKQETTFEEEETSPPQDNSADPLTQIADALSKLLVARSPREIDVSPYDGSFEAQSFFDNFDAQADRAELTYTDRLRKLPCYLQARQRLIDLFPATTEASFARFLAIKLTPQMPLEDYYQNKTVMGMKLDLPADILIESLTDGLPVADQRLIATVQPNTIKEWFDIVSRIRGTQCATSAVYQRQVDKAPHPTYHNPPPRYNNQRPSRVTVNNGSHGTEHAQSTAPDHAQPLYQNVVPTPSPRSNLRAMFPKSKLQVKTTLQAPRAPQRTTAQSPARLHNHHHDCTITTTTAQSPARLHNHYHDSSTSQRVDTDYHNPTVFSGERGEDSQRWLSDFQRVARYNKWDDSMCLANVIFYLTGTAKCWFENFEEILNS